jgi:Flp pilus assembly protein TadB
MAQTKKKRSRKHRGTPAGTVERPVRKTSSSGRKGSAQSKQSSRQTARDRRAERLNKAPTWRGSVNRAAVAAVLFGLLAVALLHRNAVQSLTLVAFMFVLYIPLGYMTDRAVYNFRQRKRG